MGIAGIAALAGGGISAVLEALPWLRRILGLVATMWILYLAYRLWVVPGIAPHSQAQPMSFVQAALFQWVNPKIWALALTAATAYGAGMPPWQEALAGQAPPAAWQKELQRGAFARFPITAADLAPHYQGAALGQQLRAQEQRWIDSGFVLERKDLLPRASRYDD
ncbi:MAG: hypothetical protein GDA40_02340 [Rhodobacteraceae bacterium]|nr:hypothetical protein [Paracoccaceae bacterium]